MRPRDSHQAFHIYQDRHVDLPLRIREVAVQHSSSTAVNSAASALQRVGLAARDAREVPHLRWTRYALQESFVGLADARQSIDALADDPAIEFASPVFDGLNGHVMSPTQDILVRVRKAQRTQAATIIQELLAPGMTVVESDFGGMMGAFRLRSASKNGFDVLDEANAMATDPRIAWAEPNMRISGEGSLTPNDPNFSVQWGFVNTGQFGGTPGIDIDADLAWDTTLGDAAIKILVIDVGVQQNHPDINQLPGADFTGEGGGGGPVNQYDNHGTPVAGCITAMINNSIGVAGVAPHCKTLAARTFIANGIGTGWDADFSWTVDALNWAVTQGVQVTNNSNSYGGTSSAIDDKYAETYEGGMVHFASAHNDGLPVSSYPAILPTVNSISAIAPSGALASFSNYGPDIAFSAPGETIYTTDRTGGDGWSTGDYTYVYGTSFASPISAGVAALILSRDPSLTSDMVESLMRCAATDLGTPGWDELYGYGMVNAYVSVARGDGAECQPCLCPCHGDPECDAIIDVFDAVWAVDVAFRGGESVFDPLCPSARTDVTCDDVTSVFDVVAIVDVAFRGGSTAQFCDPCQ